MFDLPFVVSTAPLKTYQERHPWIQVIQNFYCMLFSSFSLFVPVCCCLLSRTMSFLQAARVFWIVSSSIQKHRDSRRRQELSVVQNAHDASVVRHVCLLCNVHVNCCKIDASDIRTSSPDSDSNGHNDLLVHVVQENTRDTWYILPAVSNETGQCQNNAVFSLVSELDVPVLKQRIASPLTLQYCGTTKQRLPSITMVQRSCPMNATWEYCQESCFCIWVFHVTVPSDCVLL